MATQLKLVASNNLDRFSREWRRNLATGRIWMREQMGAEARRRGDLEEAAKHFMAASRIMP